MHHQISTTSVFHDKTDLWKFSVRKLSFTNMFGRLETSKKLDKEGMIASIGALKYSSFAQYWVYFLTMYDILLLQSFYRKETSWLPVLSKHDFSKMSPSKDSVTFEIGDRNIFILNSRSFKASCWRELSWNRLWLMLLFRVNLLAIHIFLDLKAWRHGVLGWAFWRFGWDFAWCVPGNIWNIKLRWVLVCDRSILFLDCSWHLCLSLSWCWFEYWWYCEGCIEALFVEWWEGCWWDEWCCLGTGCGVWDWIKVLNCVIPVLSTLEIDTCDIFCSTEGSRARR